jgi:type III pantothenate kinase
MTPDVVVDVGNSRVKWGRVADGRIADMAAFSHDDTVGWRRQEVEWNLDRGLNWAVAGVHPIQTARVGDWILARGGAIEVIDTPRFLGLWGKTRFEVLLDRPEQAGIDRILTAYAAWKKSPDGSTVIPITVGTAVTVDLVKPGGYFSGGAILPGPDLLARALSEHTAKLPLVDSTAELTDFTPGRSTTAAIRVGIAAAVVGSVDHLIRKWAQLGSRTWVYVTGGAASYFVGFEFMGEQEKVIHDRALTLDGLRLAAEALP